MSYCKTIQQFNNAPPITTITIPPEQFRRLEFRVIQLIYQYGGKGLDLGLGLGKSLVVRAIFPDASQRQEFCNIVDKLIDDSRPVTINATPDENGENQLEMKFNIASMLVEIHSYVRKIQPLFQFIDDHGGWPTEDGKFPGATALEECISEGNLSPELLEAINTLGALVCYQFISSKIFTDLTTIDNL